MTEIPNITCFALKDRLDDEPVADPSKYLKAEVSAPPIASDSLEGFSAVLWVARTPPHPPPWASFVRQGFPAVEFARIASSSALVIVHLARPARRFAFAFGAAGRHLLRDDAYVRGFGLRVALNLIFPSDVEDGSATGLLGFESKRRASERVRDKRQAARPTTFEVLEVDRLRDLVSAASGRPVDVTRWGSRISGADPLSLNLDISFEELGDLCRRLVRIEGQKDYLERFPWIENIAPVTDPDLRMRLEEQVMALMLAGDGDIDIAPPVVVEWERIDRFRFHFDGRHRVKRVELRLHDLLAGLDESERAELTASLLRSRRVTALDADDSAVYSWSIWRCLFGELRLDGVEFVLDDGEFFEVDKDFDTQVRTFVRSLATDELALPQADVRAHEDEYNDAVVAALGADALLMDKALVHQEGSTGGVEVCDVLTTSRQLIHVKRHLRSSMLSHLFSQGAVSATLLQGDAIFREAVSDKIAERSGNRPAFDLVDVAAFLPWEWRVVFVVVADLHGRRIDEALPFFSRVNLMRFAQDLQRAGFGVGIQGVQTRVEG